MTWIVSAVGAVGNLAMSAPGKTRTYSPHWRKGSFKGVRSVEDSIVKKVNALRQKLGLKPLNPDQRLRTAARQHALEMIQRGYYSHTSPIVAYRTVPRRACLAGYLDPFVAENIGKTSDTDPATSLFENWKRSPGHYANMVNRKMTQIGIGVAQTTQQGQVMYYATQLFATIPLDFRRLALRQERQQLLRLQVDLTVKDGTTIMAWDGRRYIGNLPRVAGGVKLKIDLPRPLPAKRTFVFGLKDTPDKPAMVCSRVFVESNGRVQTKRYTKAPMCHPITSVRANIKNTIGTRWVLRGEARANTQAALNTRFFLNKRWGPHLPLKLGLWQSFAQPLSSGRTLFAVVIGRLLKEYLYIEPNSTKAFQCP